MTDSNATTTRNVICDLPDYPDGEVTFELVTFFAAESTEGFPQKNYSLTLNATGQGTQALPVPSSGAWLWKIHLPDSNKPLATLAAGADIQLTAWLSAALSTETANSLEDFFLLLTGGTMTGAITLPGAPTADLHAATKKYVDDNAGGGGASDVTDLTTTTWGGGNFARVAVAGGLEEISPAALAAVLDSDINILNLDSFGAGTARYIRTDNINGESLEGLSAAQVLSDIGAAAASDLTTHEGDTTNPHSVTAAQAGALANIVEDTTPQLGGDLDAQGNAITGYVEGVTTVSPTTSYAISMLDEIVVINLTDNLSISFTDVTAGASVTVHLIQDGTGSRVPSWTGVSWPGGTEPTLSTAASARDKLVFDSYNGSVVDGHTAGLDMSTP